MSRYDYERYEKHNKGRLEHRYMVIDRKGVGGCANKMATVYDVADAERIVSALNAREEKADAMQHRELHGQR